MSFNLGELLVWLLVFVFSSTCHEAAHAWAAWRGGDSTAYEGGQVSLDPLPHLRREPFGMLLVPVLSYLVQGWMIGWASAPYNAEWARRYPRRHALMSLAGPGANLVLVIVALVTLKVLFAAGVLIPAPPGAWITVAYAPGGNEGSTLGAVAMVLSVTLFLNLVLGLFNLIPVPPLDGSAVVEALAPPPIASFYASMREQPLFALLGLVLASKLLGAIVGVPLALLHVLLYL